MPKFLEEKLRKEYGDNPRAIYGTMNAIGAMHGNKETAKGRAMEAKHERDVAKPAGPTKRDSPKHVAHQAAVKKRGEHLGWDHEPPMPSVKLHGRMSYK